MYPHGKQSHLSSNTKHLVTFGFAAFEMTAMYTTIQKWGNGLGLEIPQALLDAAGLQVNDQVKLT